MSEKMLSAGKGALFLTALSAISQVLGFFYRVAGFIVAGQENSSLFLSGAPIKRTIPERARGILFSHTRIGNKSSKPH